MVQEMVAIVQILPNQVLSTIITTTLEKTSMETYRIRISWIPLPMATFKKAQLNLDPDFNLPESYYAYNKDLPENCKDLECDYIEDIPKTLNELTDLKEVIKTLIPQDCFKKELPKATNKVQSLSLTCDKFDKAITRATGNPDFVHKSVKVDRKYESPKHLLEGEDYPQLVTMYKTLESKEDALNQHYQREATKLVCHGNRISYFLHKFERAKHLIKFIVERLARGHITHYKKAHCKNYQKDPNKPPQKKEVLCAKAAHELIVHCLDQEVLEYLDFNRSGLERILIKEFGKPVGDYKLSPLDILSTQHAVECMAKYIKVITVVHYEKVQEKASLKTAEQETLAELEREDSAKETC